MQRLLEGRRLLEGGAYFNVSTQKSRAYNRAAFVCGPVRIRGNTVISLLIISLKMVIYNYHTLFITKFIFLS